MTLLVDVGNTALKWATAEDRNVGRVQVELHRGRSDGLEQQLAQAWRLLAPGSSAFGCCVASEAVRSAVERAAHVCGHSLHWLASQDRFAGDFVLDNSYRTPIQLGADRWHGMLGACARRPRQSLVLIAAGTATTIDCIEQRNGAARFVGGCIAPGVRLMLDSLAQRTAGLPQAHGEVVEFPDNTDDAIATGVAQAQAGLALRMIGRFARRCGSAPAVIVSGGDADVLAAQLRTDGVASTIEHNLVLAGLALRARAAHGSN